MPLFYRFKISVSDRVSTGTLDLTLKPKATPHVSNSQWQLWTRANTAHPLKNLPGARKGTSYVDRVQSSRGIFKLSTGLKLSAIHLLADTARMEEWGTPANSCLSLRDLKLLLHSFEHKAPTSVPHTPPKSKHPIKCPQ